MSVQTPIATTNPASGISTSGATLNGMVNAYYGSTAVTFQYGLTTSYRTTVTADQSPVTGNTNTAVSKGITGLYPNMTYHYRVVGVNSAGTTNGFDVTFTTSGTVTVPTVSTNPASGITTSGAALNGRINPNGTSTSYYFQWGTSTSYGSNTLTQSAGSGTNDVNASAPINGLIPNTTYHYRLATTSSAGNTYGGDQAFKTLAAPLLKKFLYLPLILRK